MRFKNFKEAIIEDILSCEIKRNQNKWRALNLRKGDPSVRQICTRVAFLIWKYRQFESLIDALSRIEWKESPLLSHEQFVDDFFWIGRKRSCSPYVVTLINLWEVTDRIRGIPVDWSDSPVLVSCPGPCMALRCYPVIFVIKFHLFNHTNNQQQEHILRTGEDWKFNLDQNETIKCLFSDHVIWQQVAAAAEQGIFSRK